MSPKGSSSLKIDRSVKTLRELTLEKMRDAILSAYFKRGERLVERALCEELGVSRSIVREVLRHLETEGLVESIPHPGPVVATLDADKAAQIYEIRALQEGHAARLCAMAISSAGRSTDAAAEMRLLVDALQRRDAQAAHDASIAHVRRVADIAARKLVEMAEASPAADLAATRISA